MKIDKKRLIAFGLLMICSLSSGPLFARETGCYDNKSCWGYVPNEETAIRIAVAVWIPIYGKETIENEKPYKAILKDGVWYVRGSLPLPPPGQAIFGGVAHAAISKEDG